MKAGIHPETFDVTVMCTCGASYNIRSTIADLTTTLCSACHPFFTGDQNRFVDTVGRIKRFQERYTKKSEK